MTTTLPTDTIRLAADKLDADGWLAGWGTYGPGTHEPTCAHGAVLSVCGQHPGDRYLWRPIMRLRGLTEEAQDEHTKRWATWRLRHYDEPTVDEMVAVYGPQWEPIRDLVRRAATLTDDEARDLGAAWDAAGDAALSAAWDAAGDAAWYAASDAAEALVVRHLINPDGFTQEHYDQLTRPWRQVIGPAHPDDKGLTDA